MYGIQKVPGMAAQVLKPEAQHRGYGYKEQGHP